MVAATQRSQQSGAAGRDRFEDYVPVAERLERFYDRFPDGRVITQIVEHSSESGFVLVRAEVYRSPEDAQPAATGHAFEVRGESFVNKTSYVENCETSAVGRALALLGFEIKRGVASREEEMRKTARPEGQLKAVTPEGAGAPKTAAQGERAQLLTRCGELFREMNRLGYKPQWTKTTIDTYVNGSFLVKRGADDLSVENLRKLVADLETKRNRLASAPDQSEQERERTRLRLLVEAEFKRRGDTPDDVDEYLWKNCGGVSLADMSLDQLLKVCQDEEIETGATATPAAETETAHR